MLGLIWCLDTKWHKLNLKTFSRQTFILIQFNTIFVHCFCASLKLSCRRMIFTHQKRDIYKITVRVVLLLSIFVVCYPIIWWHISQCAYRHRIQNKCESNWQWIHSPAHKNIKQQLNFTSNNERSREQWQLQNWFLFVDLIKMVELRVSIKWKIWHNRIHKPHNTPSIYTETERHTENYFSCVRSLSIFGFAKNEIDIPKNIVLS